MRACGGGLRCSSLPLPFVPPSIVGTLARTFRLADVVGSCVPKIIWDLGLPYLFWPDPGLYSHVVLNTGASFTV